MIEVIKGLIGMAKSSPYKLVIILAIVTLVTGFINWQQHIQYKRGYDAAKVKYLEDNRKALAKATKAAEKDLKEATQTRDHWRDIAIGLQSRPPVRTIEYVTEIIENNPDCTSIDGFSLLHNKLVKEFD